MFLITCLLLVYYEKFYLFYPKELTFKFPFFIFLILLYLEIYIGIILKLKRTLRMKCPDKRLAKEIILIIHAHFIICPIFYLLIIKILKNSVL